MLFMSFMTDPASYRPKYSKNAEKKKGVKRPRRCTADDIFKDLQCRPMINRNSHKSRQIVVVCLTPTLD